MTAILWERSPPRVITFAGAVMMSHETFAALRTVEGTTAGIDSLAAGQCGKALIEREGAAAQWHAVLWAPGAEAPLYTASAIKVRTFAPEAE